MENQAPAHPSVDTLLAVMSEQMKTLLKSVSNIEEKLESKANATDFKELKDDVKYLSKFVWVATGMGTVVSFLASHIIKW